MLSFKTCHMEPEALGLRIIKSYLLNKDCQSSGEPTERDTEHEAWIRVKLNLEKIAIINQESTASFPQHSESY